MSPPFVYNTPQNPYAMSIGEALRQRGDIEAQRAAAIGNAQAQAAQAQGQIWGNAISGVGQDVSRVLAQQTDPQAQLDKLKLQAYKANQAGLAKANQIVAGLITEGPNGARVVDRAKAQAMMAQENVPNDIQSKVFKQLDDTDASIQKFAAAKQAHVSDLADHAVKMIDAGLDPALAISSASQLALANGVATPQELQPVLDALAKAPDAKSVRAMLASLAPDQKLTVVPEGATVINPSGAVVAHGAPKPPNEVELAVKAAQGDADAQKALDALHARPMTAAEQANLDIAQQRLAEEMRHNKAVEGEGINADDPDAAKAMQALGQFLGQTGRMPVGFRVYGKDSAKFYTGVAAAAADYATQHGTDLSTQAASYTADTGALNALQKNYDTVKSFLETADKNAELLNGALKALPDVKSPVFNQPLRMFSKSVAGNPNLSQFATYLTSVQNEYGRILNTANLSGQLTDSARHEAQQLIDPNATVPQILASLNALQKEGGNRLQSLDDQIATIKGRIGGKNAPAPSAPSAATMLQPKEGQTQPIPSIPGAEATYRNGKWIRTK